MSTTGIDSWAVDLAEVGPIYPMQGSEFILLVICVAAWIGWHIWCIRWEKQYHRDKIAKYGKDEHYHSAVDAE